jgi:hypothetical protein
MSAGHLLWAVMTGVLLLGAVGCAQVEKQRQEKLVVSKIQQKNEVWSYCYKRALKKDNTEDLEGELKMSWQVDYLLGQERVSRVAVEKSTVQSEALVNCMKSAIAKMRFNLPRKKGQAVYEVSHPFVFRNDKNNNILNR